MLLEGTYAGKPASFQFFVLLVAVLAGAIIGATLSAVILFLNPEEAANLTQDAGLMRIIQTISALTTFLLPALALAWVCSRNYSQLLFLDKLPDGNIFLLAFISLLLLSPVINLTALLNKAMTLPPFLKGVEEWMMAQEKAAEELTWVLLSEPGILPLLANLFVVAVVAAITEEFLFRGALQRIFYRWTKNTHAAIWITAFVFSSIHLQFYGFLPRMLLGAFFGYLLVWSKSIWLPVFIHFIHNGMIVVALSDENLKENEFITGEVSDTYILPYTILALITGIGFLFSIRMLKKKLVN
ncbi:MAG: CPBP family intramembrane metalloprotease [Tannerellaceae bacterium]|nr:CPBP family intramembrane metalloprotease [Tannerellaceae bacterium]